MASQATAGADSLLDPAFVLAKAQQGQFQERLAAMPGVASVLPVETNIVIFDLAEGTPDARAVLARMTGQGIGIGAFGSRRMRVVTHLDVDAAGADTLCAALELALRPAWSGMAQV